MGLISLGLNEAVREETRIQRRTVTLADFPALASILTPPVTAGVVVTEQTALNFSAYWNAVDVISGQVASLPRILYRRLPDDDRERATSHPVYRVLHDEPNPYTNPAIFWQTLMAHVLTWGNGYAEIEWDNAMRPIGLWIITPDQIEPEAYTLRLDGGRATTRVRYRYRGEQTIEAEDIIHIPGLGYDGLRGYSVVQKARRSLGLGLAAEQFGASFFGNGAWPGIVLEHPGDLTATAEAQTKAAWDSWSAGPDKAHRTVLLKHGMKANKIGIPPEDAQFLESREFQVVEMARWLNLPPHKLKHKYGERPGGNLEAGQIEFLTDTLRPWLIRIEQECTRKLISRAQRGTFYVEHLVDEILRMDGKARADAYKVYFDMGVLDAELIAKKENLPRPKPKPEPVQAPLPPAADPDPQPQAARMAAARRALAAVIMGQFLKAEGNEARRAAKKGPEAFGDWIARFYERKAAVLEAALVPLVEFQLARGDRPQSDAVKIARTLADEYVERSRDDLLGLRATDLEPQVDRLVERWETLRPVEMADRIAAIGREHVA